MNNKSIKTKPEINIFHLAIFGIFIIALIIRIYGVMTINITNTEAEVLLSVTGIKPSGSVTFFYSVIIKLIQLIGLDSNLGLRFINALMGSLIIILPAMFFKEIGKKTAILASAFFAFDPFGIVNSILFSGNTITFLFIGLLIEAIVHNRNYFVQLLILILIGNGRGFGYFISTSIIFLFLLFILDRNSVRSIRVFIIEKTFTKDSLFHAGIIISLAVLFSFLLKTPISNSTSEIANFILGWGKDYQFGNYPIVYPFRFHFVCSFSLNCSIDICYENSQKRIKNS